MKRKPKRFKLVYKIILTLFLINIVPLIVVNLILTSRIDAILQETIRQSLREGRDYIRSIFVNGMRELRSEAKSFSEEKRFLALFRRFSSGQATPEDRNRLRQLMSEFDAPYVAIYRISGKTPALLHTHAFSYFPKKLVKTDNAELLKSTSEGTATVTITDSGLLFQATAPLLLERARTGNTATAYLLMIARVRELGFLNQLRVALRKDFSLSDVTGRAILSTRFNAWGESFRGRKMAAPAFNRAFRQKMDIFYVETHLRKPHASLAFPVIEPASGRVVTVGMVSQERSYNQEQQRIFVFLQLITLISVALTVFASVFLSRSIVGPVNALVKGIKRLSDQITRGEKFRPIIIRTRDEILTLAKAYNKMAADLFQSHRELKAYSEKLEEKVEVRTRKLNEANRRMKQDLEIARTVQLGILPKHMPDNDDYAIAAWMAPMMETSGDYYDIIEIDEETIGLLVVDVSGHGIPSALVTMMAKTSFSNNAKRADLSTGEICRMVNTSIHDILGDIGFYLTAFFVKVNTRTMVMEYTNAGHHKAILFNTDSSEIDELDTDGFFIGSIEDVDYETKSVRLKENDRVLIFTDGIVEARDHSGQFYGEDRLLDFIRTHHRDNARAFVDRMIADVEGFYKEASPNDDRTILVFDVFRTPENRIDIAAGENSNREIREKFEEGIRLIRDADYVPAEAVFRKIISYEPGNPVAWFNLGITHYRQGHLEKALNAWEKTLSINPAFDKARDNLNALKKIMRQDPSG